MGIPALVVLAIVVAIAAYALGTYLRQKGELPGQQLRRRLGSLTQAPRTDDRDTQVVITWLLSQAFEQTGVRVAEDKVAYQRIVEAAQDAVQALKTKHEVNISLPFLTADATGPKHFETKLTREVIRELARY